MKKLKLTALNLDAGEALTREQMKKVIGGGTCAATWNSANQTGTINIPYGSSLTAVVNSDGSTTYTIYGTNKATASGASSNGGAGAHWCCDSCSSASWHNP